MVSLVIYAFLRMPVQLALPKCLRPQTCTLKAFAPGAPDSIGIDASGTHRDFFPLTLGQVIPLRYMPV